MDLPEPLISNFVVRVKQCRYGPMLYLDGDTYVGRSLDLYGEFSYGEARMFEQIIKPGMTVLDVGANIGCHTVMMAQRVGAQGYVVAFEPQRIIHQALTANLMLNAITNTRALHAAAGQRASSIRVPLTNYASGGNFGGLALGSHEEGEAVDVRTVDGLDLKDCHFIKIDTEGMENETIIGASKTLKKYAPRLYVENDRKEHSAELIERLFSAGYRLYWHLPRLYNPDNFYKNDENVFGGLLSRNMLCLPKQSQTVIQGMVEITSAEAGEMD